MGQALYLVWKIQWRTRQIWSLSSWNLHNRDFPGGPVVTNLPCKVMDLIPRWGILQDVGNISRASE